MKIAIRTDASLWIGSGHVMRCMVLAQALKCANVEVVFLCRCLTGNLISKIQQAGFDVIELPMPELMSVPEHSSDYQAWLSVSIDEDAAQTVAALNNIDWIIVDHYGLTAQWETHVRNALNCSILAIDDLDRSHDSDIILDQNLWPNIDQRYAYQSAMKLLGPKYALLRSSFAELREKMPTKSNQVLAFFGGGDPSSECLKLLSAIDMVDELPFNVVVVAGVLNPKYDQLKELTSKKNVQVVKFLESFDQELARSRYVLGASGVSNWERFCLNVPASVVAVADNQVELSDFLDRKKFVRYLGVGSKTTVNTYLEEIHFLKQYWPDRLGSTNGIIVDGLGAARVVNEMLRVNYE